MTDNRHPLFASWRSHADVQPADATRLLRTLCNHWRHRFTIERDGDVAARIPFGEEERASFAVAGDVLAIDVETADARRLEALRGVIENHLRRFERNEALAFEWRDAA
ncbi:DUF2218 domain-containing protein [Dokdonella sp. MW10]|uniref:DUF2218 domain-containing protein n=1 Tax=Dokdonella sp. MW10 TaxID=2992926 RepID=UPI003F821A48